MRTNGYPISPALDAYYGYGVTFNNAKLYWHGPEEAAHWELLVESDLRILSLLEE